MGAMHFLTKGLKTTAAEMALYVLAYNMKQEIGIPGAQPLLAGIRVLGTTPLPARAQSQWVIRPCRSARFHTALSAEEDQTLTSQESQKETFRIHRGGSGDGILQVISA
jgi:hypothetical protein